MPNSAAKVFVPDEAWRDEYRRAVQLTRWIDSMEDRLSIRTRRTMLRSLSCITNLNRGAFSRGYQPQESPLLGLDARAFVAELHRPDGGVVRKVQHAGPATIAELRAVLPPPGSPHIPVFPPPELPEAEALLPVPDIAFRLLLEIWPRLRPSERARVAMTARELIADRQRTHHYLPDPLQDEAFATEMLRRFVAEGLTDRDEAHA